MSQDEPTDPYEIRWIEIRLSDHDLVYSQLAQRVRDELIARMGLPAHALLTPDGRTVTRKKDDDDDR